MKVFLTAEAEAELAEAVAFYAGNVSVTVARNFLAEQPYEDQLSEASSSSRAGKKTLTRGPRKRRGISTFRPSSAVRATVRE